MRFIRVLAVSALAAMGCNAGQLGEQSHEQSTSPGTVTVRLLLPTDRTFCDVVDTCSVPSHVSFGTDSGNWLTPGAPSWCAVDCATCTARPCPAYAPIICDAVATGVAVTDVEATWDGSYTDQSTCGGGSTCYAARYVPPGRYVARMCVTPGMLTGATCTQTGPQECLDAKFDLPGPSPIVIPLVQIMGG